MVVGTITGPAGDHKDRLILQRVQQCVTNKSLDATALWPYMSWRNFKGPIGQNHMRR